MNVRGILQKKEQNKMTQVPSASASTHKSFYWPEAESVEARPDAQIHSLIQIFVIYYFLEYRWIIRQFISDTS